MSVPKPLAATAALAMIFLSGAANAFCGFYVARADTALYNDASQVVLVRDGERTVMTMNNNFRGAVDEFAIVVPVPTVLEEGQINVAERTLIEHLDAYTAPRLVEYFDEDPCRVMYRLDMMKSMVTEDSAAPAPAGSRAKSLGVTIEAEYAVGEYDIKILSATESSGLLTWLNESGYRVPPGAIPTIGSYLKQGMKFFVAKVNLKTQQDLGYTYLRPLQLAYESPKFMLPIRLGMVNAEGAQELYVYALTRTGRVETRNYRTVRVPSGMDLPVAVKADFGTFYKKMFARQLAANNNAVAMLEYAWDMAWCDPCAADPLSPEQLRELGVFWLDGQANIRGGANVFVTRLHLRYAKAEFPEDLMFIETGDRENFQGRYVIRHPWQGEPRCKAAENYLAIELPQRQREEAQRYEQLTGSAAPRSDGSPLAPPSESPAPWWQRLWNNEAS